MNPIADFFDTLADRWDELCTHDADRIDSILKQTTLRKDMHILDVGCGTGVLEKHLLLSMPAKILAVDISPQMIEAARSKYATPLVEFRHADVLTLTESPVDYIIAYSVFPHFEHQQDTIRHLAGLLVPGGELVICHSEGREEINSHHNRHASRISFGLPSAQELSEWMEPYFTMRNVHDDDQYYLVSGLRKL